MSYQVSALKYRPQRFDEVVGQNHVTETLKRGLQSNRMAHALLFCGPRGVGKTTIARILAKALNCENPTEDKEPCNSCVSCEAFNSGASFNILELDAASNNKVEDIRHLVEQVGYPPQRGRYKVFIIDEVHMLSQAAFNAFLKTLEEPPPYAVFILATTEKHKILPTILSRCQIYDFKRIAIPEMIGQLTYICEQDGIKSEKEALNLISHKADGALRDALSLFDKLNSVTSGDLSYENVIKSLNVLDRGHFFEFTDWFVTGNTAQILKATDRILADGFEGHVLLEGLLEHLRELFVSRDERTMSLMESGDRFRNRYRQQAKLCSKSFLLSAMNVVSDALFRYKEAANKRMYLELTLCKLATLPHFLEKSDLNYEGKPTAQPTRTPPGEESTKKKRAPESEVKSGTKDHNKRDEAREEVVQKEENKGERAEGKKETRFEEDAERKTAPPATTPQVKSDESIPESSAGNKVAGNQKRESQLPKLQDFGSLKNRIKEKKKNAAREKLELNEENLKKLWDKYLEGVSSTSIAVSLKKVHLTVIDNIVKIGAVSTVARNTIKMEKELLDTIRNSFKGVLPEIEVVVDEELKDQDASDQPQLSTSKEKFDYMAAENEQLKNLVVQLNLKLID